MAQRRFAESLKFLQQSSPMACYPVLNFRNPGEETVYSVEGVQQERKNNG